MRVPRDMRWAFWGGAYYEHELAYWLERLMSDSRHPVFYDVGANYGYFSLLLAPLAESVHAFEPVTTTRATLERNLADARLQHVVVHDVALSDRGGWADIRLFSSSGNNSLFDVVVGKGVTQTGTQRVRLDTLDHQVYALGLPIPGLIKMDVEGGELQVLRGGSRLLHEHHPIIVLEFFEPHFHRAGYTSQDVIHELASAGYELWAIPEDPDRRELRRLDDDLSLVSCVVAIELRDR